jgi:hypothetical protein
MLSTLLFSARADSSSRLAVGFDGIVVVASWVKVERILVLSIRVLV